MKEELENTDVEQLLREKSWAQLNAGEREAAAEVLGDETGYERVRGMMTELRAEAGIQEPELQPAKHVRENLLAAFDDEQRRRRVLWWNSLGFWLRDQLRLDIPAVRLAIAGVILVLGIFTVMKFMGNDAPQEGIANNPAPAPAPVENNNDKKLDDNVEPPGMNMLPFIGPYVYDPAPVAPVDENPGEVIEEEVMPVPDPVIDPAPGNILAVNDTVSHTGFTDVVGDSVSSPTALTFTNATSAATCFGAGNADATATGGTALYAYNWTWAASSPSYTVNGTAMNSNMAAVYTTVPNCRSLANDSKVINAMFSMR